MAVVLRSSRLPLPFLCSVATVLSFRFRLSLTCRLKGDLNFKIYIRFRHGGCYHAPCVNYEGVSYKTECIYMYLTVVVTLARN